VPRCHQNHVAHWEYSICCFLPPCDGTAMTYFQGVMKFGLWQDTYSKSLNFTNYFRWGCFAFSKCSQPYQMQGMDEKYDGHAWCKLITTNTKNSFGLSFWKARRLGHLCYVQNDCENFSRSNSCNEVFWCGECTHIVGQMALTSSTSSLGCKFYHGPPFYVTYCNGWIYYVGHRL
jgi:hypothetical protein